MVRRRDLLGAVPAALALPGAAWGATPAAMVERRALALSKLPYAAPGIPAPRALAELDYDGYREIRFRPEMALWRDLGLPFQLQMFHRGGLAGQEVELHEIVNGQAHPIAYRPEMFVSSRLDLASLGQGLGFAGFRIHAPLNTPERHDEFAVFQGASYFRAAPAGGIYGLSARGIEIGSGDYGEEFPAFRAFYIERPAPDARGIVVHALLDGPSVAGAYHFLITPGNPTVFEVGAVLFPRRPLATAGLAPLTSMYLFGAEQPRAYDDFRPEVHDSDGLLTQSRGGGRVWRALANPERNQITSLPIDGLEGFGLLQRARDLAAYQDLEALYHRRPGAWVEPIGDWGPGAARLVELHARSEGEDNIVAAWRPALPIPAGHPHRFRYRLTWGAEPAPASPLARAMSWREGQGDMARLRRLILEFGPLTDLTEVAAEVTASSGEILNIALQPNPERGSIRVGFQLDPQGGAFSDLRARLTRAGQPISETWTMRWRA